MRRFNTRLFFYLLAALAFLSGGAALVHYLQTGRIARALLWQAQRAEEQGRLDVTARYLGRYLEFQHDDVEEQAHLGRVLAEDGLAPAPEARSPRVLQKAFYVLEQIVARDAERPDLRRLLVRVAMALGRADNALGHLQALGEDGEVCDLLGQCYEAQQKYAEAAEAYW
jgi:cytochrome c-type biogenesis protein CcmH/NrfG